MIFYLLIALPVGTMAHSHMRTTTTTSPSESPIPLQCHNSKTDCSAFSPPKNAYKSSACPFAEWYAEANAHKNAKRMGNWEENLLQNYGNAFEKAGSPPSWKLNDHDYNTKLGQGNTIGFLKARVDLDPSLIKSDLPRTGMLSEKRDNIPAVVRFSDFGASTESPAARLGRLAVKMEWIESSGAWSKEINLLFTEALSVFPIADYRGLQTFGGDDRGMLSKITGNARLLWHAGKNILWDMGLSALKEAQKREFPSKEFYSQLPYGYGAGHAMKIELVPQVPSCDESTEIVSEETEESQCMCVPRVTKESVTGEEWAPARAKAIASFTSQCEFGWDIRIRVLPNKDSRTEKKANVPWSNVPAYVVGKVVVEKQDTMEEAGMGVALHEELMKHFGSDVSDENEKIMTPTHISKLFRFHPIMTHEMHKPRGQVNHFRAGFYSQHAHARSLTIQKDLSPLREKMPFDQMKSFFETSSIMGRVEEYATEKQEVHVHVDDNEEVVSSQKSSNHHQTLLKDNE